MGHYFTDAKTNVNTATSAAIAELADVRVVQDALRLADLQTLSDDVHALCPAADRNMASLPHAMLGDEDVSTHAASRVVNQPDIFVEYFRTTVCI